MSIMRCIHDMEKGTCALCEPREQPEPTSRFSHAPVIKAMFPSQCPECFDKIEVGDQITKSDLGQWVHQTCL